MAHLSFISDTKCTFYLLLLDHALLAPMTLIDNAVMILDWSVAVAVAVAAADFGETAQAQ